MKKVLKWAAVALACAVILISLYIAVAFFGNPVSSALVRHSSRQFLTDHFSDTDFRVSTTGYNFKIGSYFAYIDSPSSQDSYFTVYFDGWGRYRYDTYQSVENCSTTFYRLDAAYFDLVKSAFPEENCPFDISIGFGELVSEDKAEIYNYLNEAGETVEYTLGKDYGLSRSHLVLDGEYDIRELGSKHGSICLYIHDPEVTTRRAAELLLEVKTYLDKEGVPFQAIDFHLCEPRNAEGQNVGAQITLFQFPCSEIYAEGLTARVEAYWQVAQDHYALQDMWKAVTDQINP